MRDTQETENDAKPVTLQPQGEDDPTPCFGAGCNNPIQDITMTPFCSSCSTDNDNQ